MPTCVPIKELKGTASFAALVERSPEPIIVTRNGHESFAVMTIEQLDSLRLDAARGRLYEKIDEAQEDFRTGRFEEAHRSQEQARIRYGL